MIPISTNKIIKKENTYVITDYVDYLSISTNDSFTFSNILKITTYSGKLEILDQIDGTFIDIWLNINNGQHISKLITEPPFIIIPLYFLSNYYKIKFEFDSVDADSCNCVYNFYKDQHSNKIKQFDQTNIDKFRKTFRMIYNDIPISNIVVVNFNFNLFPEELIWKYDDSSVLPESIEIFTNVPHIGIDKHLDIEKIGSNLANTKYFTIMQPLLHHNIQNTLSNLAFYSFGINPNSYKPLTENSIQYKINNININNNYNCNIDKYGILKVYIIGMFEM